jgi:phenylalanyl-tRNA synthetase beta chain
MNLSYKWLKDLTGFSLTPEELSKKLTFGGIEVEKLDKDYFDEFVGNSIIVRTIAVEPHPHADNLVICKFDTGTEEKSVVCGAPNCRAGLVTVYAPPGCMTAGRKIETVEIKGIRSEGMLCSERDLNLSDLHKGIIELPEEAAVGTLLKDYFDLNDNVIEVEITPNRPDLLGMIGVARDLSAILEKPLVLGKEHPDDYFDRKQQDLLKSPNINTSFALQNESPDLCTRYVATIIEDVTVGESPLWLKSRLLSVGVNPINNIVDITNLVMMEYGHPLHAFDLNKLQGARVIVRNANNNEKIKALDNKDYTLEETDLVIADGEKPTAIAGVIGGEFSAINKETKAIVLEAANFKHTSIRKTAHKLKISTDSSYRFERNLSDETVALISIRAANLITELCGGKVTAVRESYPAPIEPTKVTIRPKRVNSLLTLSLTANEIITYLQRLGLLCKEQTQDNLTFLIPPYRKDLFREIDLIEEIVRLHGYNNIPEGKVRKTLTDKKWFNTKRLLQDYLVYNGFHEAINSSFTEKHFCKLLELPDEDIRNDFFEILNPLGASFSLMRTSQIPALLKNAQLNINNGQTSFKLFELGKVFFKVNNVPEETYYLSGAVTANNPQQHWQRKEEDNNIFVLKGYLEGLSELISASEIEFIAKEYPYYQKGLSLALHFEGVEIGSAGKIDPLIAERLDIDVPLFLFDIDIKKALAIGKTKSRTFTEIIRYPSVERDISFIIADMYSHREIVNAMIGHKPELIKEVNLIDVYTGKNIPQGSKSLTYSLTLCSDRGTLTEEVINDLIQSMLKTLTATFDIKMR